MKKIILSSGLMFFLLTIPVSLFAQATVSGRVTDAETGQGLPGANVVIEGTDFGAAANVTGDYSISDVSAGTQTVTASVIGYGSGSTTVNVPSSGSVTANFSLSSEAIELSGLEVLASRADEKTPVAYR